MKNHMLVQFDGELLEASCLKSRFVEANRWSLQFKGTVIHVWVHGVLRGLPAEQKLVHEEFVAELKRKFSEPAEDANEDRDAPMVGLPEKP